MSDTGCSHPENSVEDIDADYTMFRWCGLCGSLHMPTEGGGHAWRAPSGLVLPGWTCASCSAFNGGAKEELGECRCCGMKSSLGPATKG